METIQLAGMTLVTLASGGGYALLVRRRLVREQREQALASEEQIRSLEAEISSLGRVADRLAEQLSSSSSDASSGDSEAFKELQQELSQLARVAEEGRVESGERAQRLQDQLASLADQLESAPAPESPEIQAELEALLAEPTEDPPAPDAARLEELEEQLTARESELAETRERLEQAHAEQTEQLERAQEAETTLREAHGAELEQARADRSDLEARWSAALARLEDLERQLAERPPLEPTEQTPEPMAEGLSEELAAFHESTEDSEVDQLLSVEHRASLEDTLPARRVLDLVTEMEQCPVGSYERRELVRALDEMLAGMRSRLGVDR